MVAPRGHPSATHTAGTQPRCHPGAVPRPGGGSASRARAHCPRVARSDTAILYNDRSVLENHHISAVFRLMQDEELNIFVNLTKDEFA